MLFLVATGLSQSAGCAKDLSAAEQKIADANSVEAILDRLSEATAKLQTYRAKVEYRFSQPLFESQTFRTGNLYYQRDGKNSMLRMNFLTLQQDDEETQKYPEHYIFDGVWLTHINYQIKSVKRRQLTEPNAPADAFDLAKQDFPLIGFSRTDDLKKDFEIKLVEYAEEKTHQLHLKVKPDSVYNDDYTSVDFWIDKKLNLPTKIVAVTTEEDIYEIKFLDAKVNKKLSNKVFDVKIPADFGKPEVIPLEKKTESQ